jgi:oligosaccharide repeat unit polymerase
MPDDRPVAQGSSLGKFMVFDKCLALLFSLMILGQAYLVRRHVGTWLFPACIFGLFWFGYTFFPLAVLFSVPAEPYAIAFIFLCTLAFSAGSLPFDWKGAFERNAQKRETAALVYGSSFLKGAFFLATLASVIFVILNSLTQGFSLHDFFFDLFASAEAYKDVRYSEDFSATIFDPLSSVCAYVGVILGGFLFPCMPTKTGRRLILVLSFLPSILVAIAQSGKYTLFLCIAFFYAGLLVYRVSAGTLRLFEKGSIRSLTLYTTILIAITTISMLSRGLYIIEDVSELAKNLIGFYSLYAFGHIYAFCDWFAFIIGRHSEIDYSHEGAAYGYYTFTILFKLLGSQRVMPPGIYDDFYSFGESLPTNIFTIFRGLIQDFGFLGSLLFMLATGLLFHRTFRSMLINRRPTFSVALFVLMIGYFYVSFISSILGAGRTYYVTILVIWIVLQINKLFTQTVCSRSARPEPPGSAVPCLPS